MEKTFDEALKYLTDFSMYSPYQEAIDKVSAYIEQMQADIQKALKEGSKDISENVLAIVREEYIPKADYENRLKADKIAMLTEIKDAASNICSTIWNCDSFTEGIRAYDNLIQQKINALRGNIDEID